MLLSYFSWDNTEYRTGRFKPNLPADETATAAAYHTWLHSKSCFTLRLIMFIKGFDISYLFIFTFIKGFDISYLFIFTAYIEGHHDLEMILSDMSPPW